MFPNLCSTPSRLCEDEVTILRLQLEVKLADKTYAESYREQRKQKETGVRESQS